MMQDLVWHCLACGAFEKVEPTIPAYELGDKEPCIDCSEGIAVVVTGAELAEQELTYKLWKK